MLARFLFSGLVPICAEIFVIFDLVGKLVVDATKAHVIDFSNSGIIRTRVNLSTLKDVELYNIQGIGTDYTAELFVPNEANFSIEFFNSRFDLYDERDQLVDARRCDAEYFENRSLNYFANLEASHLAYKMDSSHFTRPFCPYLFKNANIRHIIFYHYGRTLLYQNTLSFYEIFNELNRTIDLNCTIRVVQFENFYNTFETSGSFASQVFASVLQIVFNKYLAGLSQAFFKDFRRVVELHFFILNVGEFFHASTNDWLVSLFHQGHLFRDKLQMIDFITHVHLKDYGEHFFLWKVAEGKYNYDYPDDDFCLFKHFPRNKMVFASLEMRNQTQPSAFTGSSEVSCTYKFLSQNNLIFVEYAQADPNTHRLLARFNDSQLDECYFESRLAICFNSSQSTSFSHLNATDVYYFDVLYAFQWIEYLGPIITFPIFSAAAFGLNLLVIIVIRSKKNEKLFDSKSFRFIEMNSAFNCVECLIYQFRLLGICLGYNSVYCSSVRTSPFVLYFGAICLYVSEVMKSCSMMTSLFFSLQRYIEASKTKNRCLSAFARTSTGRLLCLVLAYGLCISVSVFFSIDFIFSSEADNYDLPSVFVITVEDEQVSRRFETYFYFVHYVLNDFVILVLNLAVDICLVREIKLDLKLKLRNRLNISDRSSTCVEKSLKEEEKKKSSVERKANAMIIISVCIYFFCRLPELAGTFLFFYFYKIRLSCLYAFICYLIANFIEYMYMLSYFINIFLYYKFNTYFHKGLKIHFGLKQQQTIKKYTSNSIQTQENINNKSR